MILSRIVPSTEKIFLDESIDSYEPLKKMSALRGERISFQFIVRSVGEGEERMTWTTRLAPKIEGTLKPFATLRRVVSVPVAKPTHGMGYDDNYLRTTPGLYPDLLMPLEYDGKIAVASDMLLSTWIEVNIPKDLGAGIYTFSIALDGGRFGSAESHIEVEVIDAVIPKDVIYFTQWFHTDGLSTYYNYPVFSEDHWRAIENFAATAVKNGINLLLTPVFTPPLDTAVGGERLTTQLVDVTLSGGRYTFGFEKLDRWIDMCDRVGIKYLEISHLFTQWGAAHAPKIMATVDGEYKRIFGWDTDATADEYKSFLREFLTAFTSHMKARGDDERCFYHVSDEPGLDHLENYRSAKKIITDIIGDRYIMDALSKYDFYETGILDHPIPASNHIEKFIEGGVPDLWTYYCVSQWKDVSNRYHSMPAYRTRCMGMQMFKYDIKGFLHWGYNFYNNQYSADPINPYIDQCSGNGFVGGDAFSVYPAPLGEVYESSRIIVFHEGLEDLAAMKLCASLCGKERVVSEIEKLLGYEIKFDKCVRSSREMLLVRELVNSMIKKAIINEK